MVECCSVNKGVSDYATNGHRNRQLMLNMFVASLFQLHIAISQTVIYSSIYLFVTGSANDCLEQQSCGPHNSSDVQEHVTVSWSGLGESDFFYSLVPMSRGIGLLLGSFVAGFVPANVPFRFSILLTSIICLAGNLLYANATKGWMVVVAQFLGLGLSTGMLYVFFLSYVSKTCILIEESEGTTEGKSDISRMKSKKGRYYSLKDRFLTMNLLLRNIGWPLGVAISSVMAQFERTVDQYRWPGWAVSFIVVFLSVLFLLVYRNVETNPKKGARKGFCLTFRRGLSKKCCSRASLKPLTCRNVIVYTYLLFTGCLSYVLFVAISTLLAPALSDHFGFSIIHISYFNLGVMIIAFGASLVLVSLKIVKVNNRILLIVSLIVGLVGTMLATDWQAIGQDYCHLQFTHAQTPIGSFSNIPSYSFVNGTNGSAPDLAEASDFNFQEIDPPMTNFSDLADICIAGSSESHECYWNPQSRITGQFCSLCRTICRSESMSVNFVQFSLGMSLITVASLLIWMAVLAAATDCTAKDAQSTVLGILHAGAGVSLFTTPLWCIWIYDFVGKRLFGPMVIWTVLTLLSLVGCIALYKQLGPINVSQKKKSGNIKVHKQVAQKCEEHIVNQGNASQLELEQCKERVNGNWKIIYYHYAE